MDTASPRRRRRTRRVAALAALATAGALAVPSLTGTDPAAAAEGLRPFAGCDDVDAWFTAEAREQAESWEASGGDVATAAEAGSDAAARTGDAVGGGPTGTNVQEAGVDEPDLLKTDGRRVLALTGESLAVLALDGGGLRELGHLDLADQWPLELLMLGDRALVIGQREPAIPEPQPEPLPLPEPLTDGRPLPDPLPSPLLPPAPPTTVLTVVDVSDPARPTAVRTEEVEAGYLSARSSGGAVRVVLGASPAIASPEAVEEMSGADWLPHRVVRDSDGTVVERSPAVACEAVSHPAEPAGLGTVTVLTLDAAHPELRTTDVAAVAADGGMVYASPDRLFVATTRGGWGAPMPVDGLLGRAVTTLTGGSAPTQTELHGFDTTDPTRTAYVASGTVDGWLLGRWAMSARDGFLRVATTLDGDSPGDPASGTESVVTVLDERGDRLVPVGSVGGLGRGEQVRAVRWFDDLALVVTFRQTDPLYTVDLADPAAPAVVGELKIPGYSAYLHPVGDALVLGVGQDATDDGRTTGTQVSSFDLSDLAAPDRVDTLTYPATWSDVEGESRAFSYLPADRLALVPLSTGSRSGVVAVSVGEDGALSEAGRWTADGGGWVLRAVPAGDRRVVALTEGESGRAVSLLRTPDLTEVDGAGLG